MNKYLLMLALFAAVGLLGFVGGKALSFESGHAMDPAGNVSMCEQEFKSLDTTDKGYLTYNDFRAEDSLGKIKGEAPIGNTYTSFLAADTKGDGRLTQGEFCAWKNRP